MYFIKDQTQPQLLYKCFAFLLNCYYVSFLTKIEMKMFYYITLYNTYRQDSIVAVWLFDDLFVWTYVIFIDNESPASVW